MEDTEGGRDCSGEGVCACGCVCCCSLQLDSLDESQSLGTQSKTHRKGRCCKVSTIGANMISTPQTAVLISPLSSSLSIFFLLDKSNSIDDTHTHTLIAHTHKHTQVVVVSCQDLAQLVTSRSSSDWAEACQSLSCPISVHLNVPPTSSRLICPCWSILGGTQRSTTKERTNKFNCSKLLQEVCLRDHSDHHRAGENKPFRDTANYRGD